MIVSRMPVLRQSQNNGRSVAQRTHRPRRAAIAVETAIVSLVMFVLLFGIIVGGMGVFRYELVALQAREAARWTSVRGSDWADETGRSSPTKAQILKNAVLPYSTTMNSKSIHLDVYWINVTTGKAYDWDTSPKHPTSLDTNGRPVSNRVRVTVRYDWRPLFFSVAPRQMSSTSEMPMAF